MKRAKQNNKLKLGKDVVGSLTRNEQNILLAGKAALLTTSFMQCSGLTCCQPTRYCSIGGRCLEEGVENPE
ncbi:hypothetical protein [Taibaiella koreensis]|uniref:hypothetical protein n=1 Tax=Taibaiella koreensis TaxID=1268548 RepID=UPI000E59B35C|nr:hypothetical protein [Taibaiella koreensis]